MSISEDSNRDSEASHASPPPPEPKTPLWLPALGAGLLLLLGIWWATAPSSKSTTLQVDVNAGAADGGTLDTETGTPLR